MLHQFYFCMFNVTSAFALLKRLKSVDAMLVEINEGMWNHTSLILFQQEKNDERFLKDFAEAQKNGREKALPREYVHLTHQKTVTVSDFDRMNPHTVFLCFYRSCNRPQKI